jgi:hypothetical protein
MLSPPVQRVVTLLTNAGYRSREAPMAIASVPFEFAAMLVGADRALDLIVVIDTIVESESRIRQKVEGLSRALDLVASRRPLTVVLVGPTPRSSTQEALARVCRVLSVGTPTGNGADGFLSDALAVLLPLDLPQASEVVANPLGEVRKQLPTSEVAKDVSTLFEAALSGTEAVKQALCALIQEPLNRHTETDPS